MSCCGSILCFFGFHKYEEIRTLSMAKKITRKRKIYFDQEQCQRCCKVKQLKTYHNHKDVYKQAKGESDIKSCKVRKK